MAQSRSRTVLIINIANNEDADMDVDLNLDMDIDIDIAINNNADTNDYNNNGDKYTPIAEAAAKATGLPPRTKEYIRKVLRLNVYIGIHYNAIYEEYSPPGLLNVLAEEKYYK